MRKFRGEKSTGLQMDDRSHDRSNFSFHLVASVNNSIQ